MRICLVTREYPALGSHGGIGTYTQNIAQGLAALGHQVVVIARSEGPMAPFNEGGVEIQPVQTAERWKLPAGNRYFGTPMRALPFIYAAAKRFRALDKVQAFDVVEVPEYEGWGLGVALSAKCPVIVRLHTHSALVRRLNGSPSNVGTKLVHAFENTSIRRADLILANSRALAVEMASDFQFPFEQVGVLPLGIDAERFRPQDPDWLREKLDLPEDALVLLYVGRLERRKGVEVIIDAMGPVLARHPKATLVMAGFSTFTGPGQGDLLEHLRARLAELGASERVKFLGHIRYEELPRYYAGCDAFVAPSLYEPFGMIYLEAMACGKVAIGCNNGGVPEIIRHGENGLLVPSGDPAALAETLSGILDDADARRRLGDAGRATVLDQFSLPVIARRTVERYEAAIAARHARPGRLEVPGYASPR